VTSFFQAIILGIVQGITEWLPISSSGHLVIFQKLFGLEVPVIYDVVLHLGSLVVVFMVFWKDIVKLIKGVLNKDKYYLNYFIWLVVATIPIGLVGVFLNDYVKQAFGSLSIVGYGLIFTSVILFLSKYPKSKNKNLSWKSIVSMGALQSLAILPGVSRSGMTISSGLMSSVDRLQAARFSFLLFIPAILGATVFELKNLNQIQGMGSLFVGVLTTIIVGYFSLTLLLKIVKNDKFWYFSWYCLGLGILVLVLG
jgi:undecaprenyl-diphosphatase